MASATLVSSRADRAPAGLVYAEPLAVVWERAGSRPGGLKPDEVAQRPTAPVRTERGNTSAILREIGESSIEPLQLLLVVVGVLSAIFGELRDAIAIFTIIVIVSAVEAISEVRAKRALRALRDLSSPNALVRRAGVGTAIPTGALVVGDVLLVEAGSVVAADARVVLSDGLAADESRLTGETVSAVKGPEPVGAGAPLAERSSMLYAGTAVVAGAGEGVVVAVGDETEIGRLGRLVERAKEPATPLQRSMAELARAALIVAVAACVLVPLLGVLRGRSPREMLLDGLTLAFATIPEELPILVTVLVALGGLRLARQGVLLRRLRAAEAVGAMTVLLADKTGTLTENRLLIERIDGDRERVLAAAAAAHGVAAARDPIDRALVAAAGEEVSAESIARYPFDPLRRRESAVWRDPGGAWVAVKGAPEAVLDACAMSEPERGSVLAHVARLADDGLRIIAVAERRVASAPRDAADAEAELDFVGLAAFRDPLRAGVGEAVTELAHAGVRTIVVSGDHPETVAAAARDAGVRASEVLKGGAQLDALDDDELGARLRGEAVIARATPEDKLRLVRILQDRGEAVAVTGDGVNDAPALAAANVGIAMGARGTDLAREASDLVLVDDAYPTIVRAVEGGRALASQLRRAVAFYLGAKIALVVTIAVPLALGLPAPFHPVHIVILELFMDVGASVAFVSEPTAPDTIDRPPRDPASRFLDRTQIAAIALTATALTAAVLPTFLIVHAQWGAEVAIAAAVAAWLIANVAVAWSLRAQPGLPLRRNIAFPMWALAALIAAFILSLTQAGAALGVEPLTAGAVRITVGGVAVGVAIAVAGRIGLSLSRRL
ncbi:MAG TPA: cation-transporting P-type ATPase [Solirubrobacteraceae bacterium]|nr:cation-transporting P-type ATPase [Solirubrobacteraceae bacterium]